MSKNRKRYSIGASTTCALLLKTMLMGVAMAALTGCSCSPEINILGSYFPSWIVCFAVGIAMTFGIHALFGKRKVVDQLWPLPLIYTSLVCFFSCTLWMIFFE